MDTKRRALQYLYALLPPGMNPLGATDEEKESAVVEYFGPEMVPALMHAYDRGFKDGDERGYANGWWNCYEDMGGL